MAALGEWEGGPRKGPGQLSWVMVILFYVLTGFVNSDFTLKQKQSSQQMLSISYYCLQFTLECLQKKTDCYMGRRRDKA